MLKWIKLFFSGFLMEIYCIIFYERWWRRLRKTQWKWGKEQNIFPFIWHITTVIAPFQCAVKWSFLLIIYVNNRHGIRIFNDFSSICIINVSWYSELLKLGNSRAFWSYITKRRCLNPLLESSPYLQDHCDLSFNKGNLCLSSYICFNHCFPHLFLTPCRNASCDAAYQHCPALFVR